jgi:hypothetical protein
MSIFDATALALSYLHFENKKKQAATTRYDTLSKNIDLSRGMTGQPAGAAS